MIDPWRRIFCMTGLCHTFRFASDEGGCWGECCVCRKRVGYVDRATLRRAADDEAEAKNMKDLS